MFKKIYIPIVAALVVALAAGLLVSEPAYAKGPGLLGRLRRPRAALGQVTAVSSDQLTILKRDGGEQTYRLGDNTRFIDRDGNDLAASDVVADGWVLVVTPRFFPGNPPMAQIVVILPADFDPETVIGAGGVVIDVDPDTGQITLRTRLGEELTFNVGSDTTFKGQAASLADLVKGMWARVFGEKRDTGGPLAKVVRSSDPIQRWGGEVTAVDEASGELTFQTRRTQEEVTVATDENTRYRGLGEAVSSLADIQPGMTVAVVAKTPQGASESVAVMILAVNRDNLPKFDRRVLGEVVSIGTDSLTVKARDGQQYTFQVSDATQFRSRGGSVQSLGDLQVGAVVLVSAKNLPGGGYEAVVIAASKGTGG
jgi:hypothetical protein